MNDLILKEIKPDDPNYFKPLDELIEDLGHAEPAKQYGNVIITVEDLTDALYYLQLFQKHEERVRGQLADLKEEFRPNDPLTWDELKSMEGKPVWVECKFYSHQWAIIGEVTENRIRFYGPRLVDGEPQEEMCETWQAYRKERFDE